MLAERDAEKDPASAVIPPVLPTVAWRVAEIEVLPGFRLRVQFRDGLQGMVDLNELIHGAEAGVFASLRDPGYFEQAQVVLGAVTWPNEVDLAPDAIYAEIAEKGVCILR